MNRAGLTLVSALVWRTRREGVRYLLAPVLVFVFVAAVQVVAGIGGRKAVNGAGSLAAYARRFGVTTDAAQVGATLATVPGQVAVVLSVGGAIVVRNLIGSEAGRGALEAILASGYRPRSLVVALLAYSATLIVALWLPISTLALAWVWGTAAMFDATLHLGVGYYALLLVTPLFAALAGTAFAIAVSLLLPSTARQGQAGLSGGGGIGGIVAVVPSLLVALLVVAFRSIPITDLVIGTMIGAVALLVGSVAVVSALFRVEGLLET